MSRPLPMRCSAFGLDVESRIALPGRWCATGAGLPRLSIEPATPEQIESAWSGAAALGWQGRIDGRDLVVEHGRAGDLRLRLRGAADLHLSSAGARLLVADHGDHLATLRLLLDSALFTVSLRHGYEALHAGAVTTEAGLLAIVGPAGAGKSSLLAALLVGGAAFHTDDVLVLRCDLRATPGPPVLTVPSPPPAGIGEPIADVGGESWLSVIGAAADRPLAGMVCLEPGDPAPGPVDWRWLLAQLLRFPRTPERERARLELAAELAARVPALRMRARSAPPDRLAERAREWLRSLP